MSGPGSNSFFVPISIAALITIYLVFLFGKILIFQNVVESSSTYKLLLYGLLPVFSYILTFSSKLITQSIDCGSIDLGKAAMGALPVLGTIYIGLLVSFFSIFRIPVVSIFASGDIVKSSKAVSCCLQKRTIGDVEKEKPYIKALAYGFYLTFAIFFGVVLGNGYSTLC